MMNIVGATLLAMSLAVPAGAASLLTNGGFETGDFTGWTQTSGGGGAGCATDWYVSNTDTQCQFTNTILNAAPEGSFAAYNSFDGNASSNYTMEQDIALSATGIASATLSWQQSYGWDFSLGSTATLDRIFSLSFFDLANSLIGDAYTLSIGPSDGVTGFVDWTGQSVDVTSLLQGYAGQTVTLVANVFVPQNFTGPGSLGADAFQLHVQVVPIPASALLLAGGLLGLGGLRRLRS